MKHRQLGKTGLKVSEICLGTMTFGSNFFGIAVLDQSAANCLVSRSLEAGVNFFDTADMYSFGESEEMLGKAIKESGVRRDYAIIATKVRSPMSQDAINGTGDFNNVGLSRHHIMAACEASLRRLGTDYIDLYQVHGWDKITPLEETMRALDDLVRQGKVRYLGCSNWSARHLAKSLAMCRERGWEPFVSQQTYYSLAARDMEHELIPLSHEEGVGVLPWSPLSGGFLTGKFRRDKTAPEGARRAAFDFPPLDDSERAYDVVDALEAVAERKGATIAQVALAWVLAQPAISSVIIGAKTIEQLEDNLRAADVSLTQDEIAALSAVTQPRLQYPQWMIERQNAAR
jgi:aryl-alcohol dehydrogenase-like predicted oxidoreductase